jgi:hypothetical protein
VIKYLIQMYDLSAIEFRGASAGALIACLAACQVRRLALLTSWVWRHAQCRVNPFIVLRMTFEREACLCVCHQMTLLLMHAVCTQEHVDIGGAAHTLFLRGQVQPDTALAAANQLALDYEIWERPLGLAGVWGGLVRAWLDELLPDDAHERCSGRVKLVVTEARPPSCCIAHRFTGDTRLSVSY